MLKKICCLLLCIIMFTGSLSYAAIESASWNVAESKVVISGTTDDNIVTLLSYIADTENTIDVLPDGDITGSVLHMAEITPVNEKFDYSFTVMPGNDVISAMIDADGSKVNVYCFSEAYVENMVDRIAACTADEIKTILENPANIEILGIDNTFSTDDLSAVYTKLENTEFNGTVFQKLETLQFVYLRETFFLKPDLETMELAETNNLFSKLGFDTTKIKYYTDLDESQKSTVISRIGDTVSIDEWVKKFYTELALYGVYNLTYGYMADVLNEFDDVLMLDNWPLSSNVSATKVYKAISGQAYATPSALDDVLGNLSSSNTVVTKPSVSGGGGSGGGSYTPSYQKPVVDTTLSGAEASEIAPEKTEMFFDDIDNYQWAHEAIDDLYTRNIISGYGNNKFIPNKTITRAEILKMLVAAFETNSENKNEFKDVPESHWVYPYLKISGNLASGDGTGKFNPDADVRREDIAVLIVRALGLENVVTENYTPFADDKDISDYARDSVYMLKELEVVNGTGEGFFPDSCATRAEAAVMIYRALAAKER